MTGENNAKKTPGRGKGRPFKPGNPGKPKGAKNKISKNIKDNFEAVFEKLGGIKGFCDWAKENRQTKGAFYQMYSKMLPTNVMLEGDLPIIFEVSEKFMPKKKDPDARK